ncbi:MAG: carboxypeptidase regulatory-like domain-containing protein, partial [Armatimonadetes bacterium]|nr:carboxypeptidase regulatory-like domain-containing protein [Armatimonadota bacterium]
AFAYRADASSNWEIYTINLNTLAIQRVTFGDGNKRHPTFSMDGNWIAFQWDINGNWDIYKTPTTQWAPVQLTTSPQDDTDPAWCPAANLIAYTGSTGAAKRIFLMDQDGGNQQVLSTGGPGGQGDDVEPAWLWLEVGAVTTLDIVFASNRTTSGADPYQDYNIFRMTQDGEIVGPEAVLLSNKDELNDDADDRNPAVSPELQRASMRVFFQSTRADASRQTQDIWAFFVADHRPPELVTLPWVSQREVSAGSSITISARVRDWDSGVQSVTAILKDPEPVDPVRGGPASGAWLVNWTSHDPDFDSSTTGVRFLEYDYPVVARVPLDLEPGQDPNSTQGAIFSAVYDTQLRPHDYVIDIEVVDEVGNTLIYDDVYGFTTRPFQPRANVLFVNDYCEGQSFLYKLGYNNDYAAAYPVESYYLYNPSGLDPMGALPAGGVRFDSIRGYYGERYDVWRIICRGPVPAWVYQYYLPTVEYQLEPDEALSDPDEAQPTRRVLVADRAIVWASPHTGDLWVADGSLLDAATQADLALFLDRGGRLFISGEDIAWALTMNGTTPNEFLSQYLRAGFLQDTPVLASTYPHLPYPDLDEPVINGQALWWRLPREIGYAFEATGQQGDPVADDPWAGAGPISMEHEQYLHISNQPDHPVHLVTPRLSSSAPDYTDAAEFSFRPDTVQVLAGATKLYGLGGSYDGPAVGLRYSDLTTGAKVIYLAFGFEQIHRVWSSGTCYNHRANLMHNALCWMRTGGFQGRVLGINGQPITNPNPIVYCYHQRAGQGREIVAAVRCQDDGTYVMQGLGPDFYTLEATRPGYTIDKYDGEFIHGGLGFRVVDFVIKQQEPGAIAGLVTAEGTGEAVQGAQVCANPIVGTDENGDPLDPPPGTWPKCVQTGPDGSYTIGDLPAGDYEVTVDGTAAGYGTAGPETVTVNPGGTTRADFALPAADGQVVATVMARDGQGNVVGPLAGATVEVLDQGRKVADGVTGNDGVATISVQPGQYTVVADAPGYGRSTPQAVTVRSQQDTAVTVYMDPQPPGSLSGRIVSAVSGQPVGGITIRLLVSGTEYASVVSSATFQQDTPNGPWYNFKFNQAPAGTVVVRPAPQGYSADPQEISVTVVSGQETSGLLFRLSSLHTFAAGLQLMSLPGDYTTVDPKAIFGFGPNDRLRLAAWVG